MRFSNKIKDCFENIVCLPAREYVSLAKPENNTCELGQFVIEIVVNREGQVIDAKLKQKNSTIASETMQNSVIAAAVNSRFEMNMNAPSKQKGYLIYNVHFK